MEKEVINIDFPLEKRFSVLSDITRATYFTWRKTVVEAMPDVDPVIIIKQFWINTAKETAKNYLKRFIVGKPLARQVAEAIVWSSIVMGEDAKLAITKDENEAFVLHMGCPWYNWHKKFNLLNEDRIGCDIWFGKTIEYINEELGTNIKFETQLSLPDGADNCTRRIWCD